MRSTDVDGLSEWKSWPRPALSQLPNAGGVYVFRLDRSFGRINGESDILYIGKSGKSISKRLERHPFNHIPVLALGTVQVAWRGCASEAEANVLESRLIGRYVRNHLELPPFNRQQPFKVLQHYFTALAQFGRVPEVDAKLEESAMAAIQKLEQLVSAR